MPTTSRAILHFFKLLRLARATPVGWNRMRMGAAQGAPRRRRGLWHVCSHARRRGDDIQVEGSIFAMRGLTAPCAPSLVSYVPAQLERVRATTRRLVGGMRTARAHAAMWSAGARTHARELWRDKRRKARCEQFATWRHTSLGQFLRRSSCRYTSARCPCTAR